MKFASVLFFALRILYAYGIAPTLIKKKEPELNFA